MTLSDPKPGGPHIKRVTVVEPLRKECDEKRPPDKEGQTGYVRR